MEGKSQETETTAAVAHPSASNSACSNTVCVALSCLSGGQPAAIQDLHRTLLNDPPSGTEDQDLPALAAAYQVAVGAARRLLEWRQNQEEDEAEKKAGLG